jgi:hypothetical protein
MSDIQSLQVPNGAQLMTGRGDDARPARISTSTGDVRRVDGVEKPASQLIAFDPRHCNTFSVDADGRESQCMGWPVKKEENPNHLCAGHLRKQKLADGNYPTADEGLSQGQS